MSRFFERIRRLLKINSHHFPDFKFVNNFVANEFLEADDRVQGRSLRLGAVCKHLSFGKRGSVLNWANLCPFRQIIFNVILMSSINPDL